MTFQITVTNTGADGTVQVTERLNDSERIQVFSGILSNGQSVDVQAQGNPPKNFDWVHLATNLIGGPESKGNGDVISVAS